MTVCQYELVEWVLPMEVEGVAKVAERFRGLLLGRELG